MAELITLYGRNGAADTYTNTDLETIADRILPSNAPREVEVTRDDGIVTCRINAPESMSTERNSTCLGRLIPPTDDWHEIGAPAPDGSYGIVRTNSDAIELVADETASRTIYYRLFEDLFVASTSQRAIAHFAEDFVLHEPAIAWMISSGTLGPRQVWDKRIEHVPPGGIITLNRQTWELSKTRTRKAEFNPSDVPKSTHRERLETSLDETFEQLEISNSWELPISGGLDSRELLLRLCDRQDLHTLTWGTASALNEPESDAVRAKELAEACGVSHRYYTLPEAPENVEEIFSRFVIAGEGRIDHVSGYVDGFDVFADLAENGVNGLIRGDEGFGWVSVTTQTTVRNVIGARMINDYETLPEIEIPGRDRQQLLDRFKKSSDESLAVWRDRLYHTYRIPIVLGALTALKTPYIEIINPFLTRNVLETVRRFPDEFRTDKNLYTEYVRDRSPDVPVATQSANPNEEQILKSEASRRFLRNAMDTDRGRKVLGPELVEYALDGLKESQGNNIDSGGTSPLSALKRGVGKRLPQPIIELIEQNTPIERPPQSLSAFRLGFRMYIILQMVELLEKDVRYDL